MYTLCPVSLSNMNGSRSLRGMDIGFYCSEIHYQNKSGIQNLASWVISYLIVIFIILFMLLTLWQWWKSRKQEVLEKLTYFATLVEGFKASWIWRSYWLVFLIRRFLFIVIIFFMEDYDMMNRIAMFVKKHLCFQSGV